MGKWTVEDIEDMGFYQTNECPCGSSELYAEIYDVGGIYVTIVCSKCKKWKLGD